MGLWRHPGARSQRSWRVRAIPVWIVALTVVLAMGACVINPATRRPEFTLVSEPEEIALGLEADRDMVETLGLYADSPALTEYVSQIGAKLAAKSERPNLPWTFRVLDDPVVNAFAIPGGHVYVTRGILAHLDSEAELAGVIGHEIGHVTALHGVNQLSRARVADRGLGIFRVLDPRARHVGRLANNTAALIMLRHSRGDEIEADDLGLRYMGRGGYDRTAMVDVMRTLERQSAGEASDMPIWLSTHPEPGLRADRILDRQEASSGARNPGAYREVIQGLAFGKDPRLGFQVGDTHVSPRRRYRIDLPPDWTRDHDKDVLIALSPDETALLVVGVTGGESADAAAKDFYGREGVVGGPSWEAGGGRARDFTAPGQTPLAGTAVFRDHAGETYLSLVVTPAQNWSGIEAAARRSLASFARLEDPRLMGVQPARLVIEQTTAPVSIEQLAAEADQSPQTMAILNRVTPTAQVARGTWLKRVRAATVPTGG